MQQDWSQDSSVGIVIGYRLDARGSWVSILERGKRFSFLRSIQTDSESLPSSYSVGTGSYFPEGKAEWS